jgi:hypothetical protein
MAVMSHRPFSILLPPSCSIVSNLERQYTQYLGTYSYAWKGKERTSLNPYPLVDAPAYGLWVIRGQLAEDFDLILFGRSQNLWVIRGYALWVIRDIREARLYWQLASC